MTPRLFFYICFIGFGVVGAIKMSWGISARERADGVLMLIVFTVVCVAVSIMSSVSS